MKRNEASYEFDVPVSAVTPGDGHYFFGYYDKCPWDAAGRRMLAMRAGFMDRAPEAGDEAVIGLIDLSSGGGFEPLASTKAWNWQQGCMLRWLPSGEIIFNIREKTRFASAILNIKTGKKRVLPHPVYAVSPCGNNAITVNFSRLHENRPGYGYAGIEDEWRGESAPREDGIYSVDLDTGESRLLISIASVAGSYSKGRGEGLIHWFNHLEFSPWGGRFVFLHRWRESPGKPLFAQFFSANPDGSDLYCLADSGMTSHFGWLDEERILAWARLEGIGDRYFLFKDKTPEFEIIGDGLLVEDGHCSLSPGGEWILTDTYPDKKDEKRSLLLYHRGRNELVVPGRFYGPFPKDKACRCDLHPRWSRDGRNVCFDSVHEGARRMYVADVSSVVGEGE